MADPLSMGASIIAFIEITNRIVSTCKYCIETIKDAPKDFQMILGETISLEAIIETLKALGTDPLGLSGTLESCRRCLLALESLLPKPHGNGASRKKCHKITFAELAWPLKESKARKLLSEVSQHKATLLLAISGDMAHDIKAIRASVNNVAESVTDAERLQILHWLETTNPSTIHNQAWKKHHEETTSWLLRSPEWNDWLSWNNSKDRFLWCFGIPGCGKTVMASFINEELKRHCAGQEGAAHAYYYCHYSHNQDESAPFLRWIISQACRQARWVPPQLKDMHDGGCEPSLAELNNILGMIVSNFTALYVVVDAVDESSPRGDLIALLATMGLDQRFCNVRLLVTSRQYSDIENVFSGISVPLSMSNALVSGDIRRFIRNRLARSRHIQKWPSLAGRIEDSLVSGAQGMFRWAECQIYTIERLRTESQILEALHNLPRDLAETYVRIFQAIPEEDRPFVRRALIWLGGHASAPWHTNYGIKGEVLASAASHDLDPDGPEPGSSFYNIDYLGELIGCLISISSNLSESDIMLDMDMPSPVDSTQTRLLSTGTDTILETRSLPLVTLAHYTVMEFLESPFIQETDVSYFALSASVIIAEFKENTLRQAVSADPQGSGVSWLHDREAYCLTLAPALIMYEEWQDHTDLALQYCDPRSPHYSRIPRVQEFLTEIVDGWSFYCIYNMPEFHLQGHPTSELAGEASILLNILLVSPESSIIRSLLQALLSRTPDLMELLTTRLTVTLSSCQGRQTLTGTVLRILFHHEQGLALGKLRWLVEWCCLNPTAFLMELVSSRLNHQFLDGSSMMNLLTKHGADPNGPSCFLTPLKASVYHGSLSVSRLLLEAGANPNFTGNFPREVKRHDLPEWVEYTNATPLALLRYLNSECVSHGQLPQIERLLLDYGAVM